MCSAYDVKTIPPTPITGLGTLLLVAVAVLMVLPAGCGGRRVRETPVELIGVWTTSYERYAGAAMEFTAEYLILRTVENTVLTYLLTGFMIEEDAEEGRTNITVFYEDAEGNELSMELAYTDEDGGTLVDLHQRNLVWKKGPA